MALVGSRPIRNLPRLGGDMDIPWKDPKFIGPVGGCGLLALICIIGWAVSSSHAGKAEKAQRESDEKLATMAEDLKRAKHDAEASKDFVETVKKQRDEQSELRK